MFSVEKRSNFYGHKLQFKGHLVNKILYFIWKLWNESSASFINSILNDHSCLQDPLNITGALFMTWSRAPLERHDMIFTLFFFFFFFVFFFFFFFFAIRPCKYVTFLGLPGSCAQSRLSNKLNGSENLINSELHRYMGKRFWASTQTLKTTVAITKYPEVGSFGNI